MQWTRWRKQVFIVFHCLATLFPKNEMGWAKVEAVCYYWCGMFPFVPFHCSTGSIIALCLRPLLNFRLSATWNRSLLLPGRQFSNTYDGEPRRVILLPWSAPVRSLRALYKCLWGRMKVQTSSKMSLWRGKTRLLAVPVFPKATTVFFSIDSD